MNKFVHMRQKGRPFPLLSAFAPDAIRGHIYVEAANPGQACYAIFWSLNLYLFDAFRFVKLSKVFVASCFQL